MKKLIALLIVIFACAGLFISCQQTAVTSAKVYMQQQNWDKAVEQALVAVKQMPTDAEAYFVLGEAYGKKGMYVEMNDAFDKALELSDQHKAEIMDEKRRYYGTIFNEGVSNYKQNRMDEAIEKFKLAIKIMPERTEAYKNLSFAYAQNDQDSLALQVLQEGLKYGPNDSTLRFYLGLAYYGHNQYNEAIKNLEAVMQAEQPGSELYNESLYHIAIAYDFLGQNDKALEKYQEALAVAPDNVTILFNLGRLYQQRKDYDSAIIYFKKVIDKDPTDFGAYLSIGFGYLSKEQFKEAVPYYEKAVELKPDNINAWNSLGTAYIRSGMVEEGKKAYDKAKELAGEQ